MRERLVQVTEGTIPPFIGYSNLNSEQKEDRAGIFGKDGGTLDYVSCWYKKSADYMRSHHIRAALVSTNSICQGQQVAPLWKPLFADGIHIDFAHRTFVWNSQADDVAHVHVIIVGFSRENVEPKLLFTGSQIREAAHINGYLSAMDDVYVAKRATPISPVPTMKRGGGVGDWGLLTLSEGERDEMVKADPEANQWIRPFSMGAEFIKGEERFCLWMPDINPTQLKYHPLILDRVKAVREKRLSSNRKRTLKAAETPWRFDEPIEPCGTFLALPQVSSGRRKYIPIGFITTGLIPGNKLFFVDGAGLYEFGVLMSRVHNAWMRMVAGRLKSDYQYSSTIVYNTFAWPDTTPQQRERIETCAQAILDARDFYVGSTLADLYDPDDEWMYPKLVEAHRALDAAVEAAYGVDFNGDEEKIVAHLFKLYAEKTKEA